MKVFCFEETAKTNFQESTQVQQEILIVTKNES